MRFREKRDRGGRKTTEDGATGHLLKASQPGNVEELYDLEIN